MKLLQALWCDESGAVLSAEAVLLGTVALTGASVGLSTLQTSLNEELADLGRSLRSLDQSYSITGQANGTGSWTAGSSFQDNTAADVAGVQLQAPRSGSTPSGGSGSQSGRITL